MIAMTAVMSPNDAVLLLLLQNITLHPGDHVNTDAALTVINSAAA
jgi:hypothetical protein